MFRLIKLPAWYQSRSFLCLVIGYMLFWQHRTQNSSIQGLCQATNLYEIADSLLCCMTAESHRTSEFSGLAICRTNAVWRCKPLFVIISILILECWDDIKPPVSVSYYSVSPMAVCMWRQKTLAHISDEMGWWHSASATPVCLQHILPDLRESTTVCEGTVSAKN